MSKKKVYRDILYLDTDKVQSILAQMNKGLINSFFESTNTEHKGKAEAKTNKFLELLLQLPLTGQVDYQYTRSKGLQEEKSLHDFALTELINILPLRDVSSLDRDQLSRGKNRVFVKIKGVFTLYDYEYLARTLERFKIVSHLFGGNLEDNHEIVNFTNFIKTAYEGLTAIEIKNKKDVKFLGAINTEFLRETMRNFMFKYGNNPEGDWEMICQITNIPRISGEDIMSSLENLEQNIDTTMLQKSKSLGSFMNELSKEFNKINDMFSTVTYPDISVEPIAIYREIKY